ncbi:hypothetical protein [Lutibacter maritimus]|uniref:Uncharacterized protein n=1 Tax=Lutibacter maritimus TaxID=593133 RepID=A0A1I6NRB9_9FLAO|nr:hypothetical protein [Lutibacter maritimus]SFS30430.1 hypothetical protein SAMN04488006_0436 [Lutibacter maritimus]
MLAETVYPIIKALDVSEQFKLFKQLEKDIQLRMDNSHILSEKAQRKIERIKWLKKHIFYPPK